MIAGLKLGGIGAAAGFALAWFAASSYYGDKIEQEITRCNADKLVSVAQAEKLAREATEEAAQAKIAQYARIAKSQQKAREIVAAALREAEAREPEIRTIVREIPRDTDAQKCLDMPVPADLLRSLRN